MEKKMNKIYSYAGIVLDGFGKILDNYWEGETWASSKSKAKSNLMHQYKKDRGMPLHTKVDLPATIREQNTDSNEE